MLGGELYMTDRRSEVCVLRVSEWPKHIVLYVRQTAASR